MYENPNNEDNLVNEKYLEYEESLEHENYQEGSSSKNKKIAIIIIAVVLVLLAIIGVLAYKFLIGNDKLKVAKAFKNLSVDEQAYQERIITTSQAEYMINQIIYGDMAADYSINLSGLQDISATLGVDGTLGRKFDDKALSFESTISVMNAKVSDVNVYADDTVLYVNVPLILEETIMADTDGLADNVNNSALAEVVGLRIPDDIDYRPFGDGVKGEIKLIDSGDLLKNHAEDLAKIGETMEVTHDKDKAEIGLSDGTTATCVVYHMTIPMDAIAPILKDIVSQYETSASLTSDILMSVYVDKDSVIRSLATDIPIVVGDLEINIEAQLTGVDNALDEVSVKASTQDKASAGSSTNEYVCDWSSDPNGKIDTKIKMTGDMDIDASYAGMVGYDSDMEKLSLDIDGLSVSVDGTEQFYVSGDVDITAKDVSVVAPPTNDVIDLLNMNFLEMVKLVAELGKKYEDILNVADLMGM